MDLKALEVAIEELKEQREAYLPTWRNIAKYVAPGRGKFDDVEPNSSDRREIELLDSTPFHALTILAAGMQGGLTSPSRPWFKLGISNLELADNDSVRAWLDELEQRMLYVMGRSNIYNSLHTLYGELGAFGTAALYIEEDEEYVIRGHAMTAGEYCAGFSASGLPETFARTFWMTAQQLEKKFGRNALSDPAKSALEGGKRQRWFKICHVIAPNSSFKNESPSGKNMKFMSVYWEWGRDKPLRRSGYAEFPVLAPRWEVFGNDTYGSGPGWIALGESKMLQELRKDYLIAQKLSIHPPLMAPTNAKRARASLAPGMVTYYDGDVGHRPIYQVQPNIPGQLQAMEESRSLINKAFFADLFLMIASSNRDMTAREVSARQEEKMLMLGPVLERLENELLDPLISRVFSIMERKGLIPEPPEELAGAGLEVEYISVLAQAQKMVGIEGIERLMGFVGNIAGIAPEVLDKIDPDEAADQYAKKLGVPSSVVRGRERVAELRAQREMQQQEMQQMAMMQQMAQTAEQGAGAANQMAQAAESGGVDMEQIMGALGAEAGVPE